MDISREIPALRSVRAFSKVFSFYCLHWVRDQQSALGNIHRLLRPGGEALLVFLAKNPVFDAYRRMAKDPRWAPYMEVTEQFDFQSISGGIDTFKVSLLLLLLLLFLLLLLLLL